MNDPSHILALTPSPQTLRDDQVGDIFGALFLDHYHTIAKLQKIAGTPGLAIVAIDTISNSVSASAHIPASTTTPRHLVVGSHDEADIQVAGDPHVSSRHLVIVVEPSVGQAGSRMLFQAHDLATSNGFCDETGQALSNLRADGPALIRIGGHALLLFPTTGRVSIASPQSAFARLDAPSIYQTTLRLTTSRPFEEESRAHREPTLPTGLAFAPTRVMTSIGSIERTVASTCQRGESFVGCIRVSGPGVDHSLRVGASALEAGVLIGRGAACESFGEALAHQRHISRGHLLILMLLGQVYAFDLASTCGVRRARSASDWHLVRVAAMEPDTIVALGRHYAQVTYQPC